MDATGLELLIEKIKRSAGFDFSGYTRPSLMRRAESYLSKKGISLHVLLEGLDDDPRKAHGIIQELTVNYSEMFRDPEFFSLLSSEILGYLESFAALRFWVAGCSAGEEAFSLAITLRETGLDVQSLIYATDLSERVLKLAREGVFSLSAMRNFSVNYLKAGGKNSLSDYYRVAYGRAVMNAELSRKIVFSRHDLTSDGVFNEFQLVSCRNVLIYFTMEQRKLVFRLLYESLALLGFLCLGKRESLRYSGIEEHFRIISMPLNIYQKIS